MNLVSAYGEKFNHVFARWEGGGERFNIEATNIGLNCPPDDYYRRGRYRMTPDIERAGRFLRSMSPREELSGFLAQRGHRWLDYGNHREAALAFAWSLCLEPDNKLKYNTLVKTCNDWGDAIRAKEPPGFPPIHVIWGQRRFASALAEDFERDILFLGAWDSIVLDSRYERTFWAPMRRGEALTVRPVKVNVLFTEAGYQVDFEILPEEEVQHV